MLTFVIPGGILLNVILPIAIMPSVNILSVIMPIINILSVIDAEYCILYCYAKCHNDESLYAK